MTQNKEFETHESVLVNRYASEQSSIILSNNSLIIKQNCLKYQQVGFCKSFLS